MADAGINGAYQRMLDGVSAGKINQPEFTALGMQLSGAVDKRNALYDAHQNAKGEKAEATGLKEFDGLYDSYVKGDHNPTTDTKNEVDEQRLRTFAAMHTVVSEQATSMGPEYFQQHMQPGHQIRLDRVVQRGAGTHLAYYEDKLKPPPK